MSTVRDVHSATTWAGLSDDLKSEILGLRDQAEREGSVPRLVVDHLAEAGVFRLLTPREYRGLEESPRTVLDVTRELAALDASVAWLIMAACNSSLLAARMDPAGAMEVFAGERSVVAGSLHKGGSARRVEGGYVVSGRWRLSSGAARADWLICGAAVEGEDHERPTIFLTERAGALIHQADTLLGLRGSGTDDFSLAERFVPQKRSISPDAPTIVQRPLYRSAMANFINPPLGAIALGIADRAIETFRDLALVRTTRDGNDPISRQSKIQDLYGRALSLRDSAAAYLGQSVDRAWEEAHRVDTLSADTTAELFLATSTAMHNSVELVTSLYSFSGASVLQEQSVLSRCLRDVHVASHHDAASELVFARVGDFALNGRRSPAGQSGRTA